MPTKTKPPRSPELSAALANLHTAQYLGEQPEQVARLQRIVDRLRDAGRKKRERP
jgi:hypothetical protein